jgi:hypothetical protein
MQKGEDAVSRILVRLHHAQITTRRTEEHLLFVGAWHKPMDVNLSKTSHADRLNACVRGGDLSMSMWGIQLILFGGACSGCSLHLQFWLFIYRVTCHHIESCVVWFGTGASMLKVS